MPKDSKKGATKKESTPAVLEPIQTEAKGGRKSKKTARFSEYLESTQISEAFKMIISELLSERPEGKDIFTYMSARLREIGQGRRDERLGEISEKILPKAMKSVRAKAASKQVQEFGEYENLGDEDEKKVVAIQAAIRGRQARQEVAQKRKEANEQALASATTTSEPAGDGAGKKKKKKKKKAK